MFYKFRRGRITFSVKNASCHMWKNMELVSAIKEALILRSNQINTSLSPCTQQMVQIQNLKLLHLTVANQFAKSNKVWPSPVSAINHLTQFSMLTTCIFSIEGPEKMSFCIGSNSSVYSGLKSFSL